MKIIHVFRAPMGGLFRHVANLANLQMQAGHDVGIIVDKTEGDVRAEAQLAKLNQQISLGVHRVSIHRNPHISDIVAQSRINTIIKKNNADIIHGHGSKGGLFARLPSISGSKRPLRVYTPHGGSLHYVKGTFSHAIFMRVERFLERSTDLLLFESQYAQKRYFEQICISSKPSQVVFNGLFPEELTQIQHNNDAADFMFIGELRVLKGVATIIQSIHKLTQILQRPVSLNIYGTGPDEVIFRELVSQLNLTKSVHFKGSAPAHSAFESGKIMIMGSDFESMPYVVLEAAGCGQPIISTNVGGIPEIFDNESSALIKPSSVEEMSHAMVEAITTHSSLKLRTEKLKLRIATHFSAQGMSDAIEAAYHNAINYKANNAKISLNLTS